MHAQVVSCILSYQLLSSSQLFLDITKPITRKPSFHSRRIYEKKFFGEEDNRNFKHASSQSGNPTDISKERKGAEQIIGISTSAGAVQQWIFIKSHNSKYI